MITISIPYYYKHYVLGLIGVMISIILGICGYIFSEPGFYEGAITILIGAVISIIIVELLNRTLSADELLPKHPIKSVITSYSDDALSLKYFHEEGNIDKFYKWASDHLYFKINNEDLKYVMIPGDRAKLYPTIYKEQIGIYTTIHPKSGMLVPMCHQSLKYYYDRDFIIYKPLIMCERNIGKDRVLYSYTLPTFGVLFRVYLLFHIFPIDVCIKLGNPYISKR